MSSCYHQLLNLSNRDLSLMTESEIYEMNDTLRLVLKGLELEYELNKLQYLIGTYSPINIKLELIANVSSVVRLLMQP